MFMELKVLIDDFYANSNIQNLLLLKNPPIPPRLCCWIGDVSMGGWNPVKPASPGRPPGTGPMNPPTGLPFMFIAIRTLGGRSAGSIKVTCCCLPKGFMGFLMFGLPNWFWSTLSPSPKGVPAKGLLLKALKSLGPEPIAFTLKVNMSLPGVPNCSNAPPGPWLGGNLPPWLLEHKYKIFF